MLTCNKVQVDMYKMVSLIPRLSPRVYCKLQKAGRGLGMRLQDDSCTFTDHRIQNMLTGSQGTKWV